ncbi:MAG: tRNA (N(6)-L-threonylcarbamoyladenosine(37)-C(2))-methylthiotransferase MtaB [Oscillospiraceae bacterium]|nr:tRNA (N(6)-L-threonylcarbamoyladenosine(37)-C(2))-methylthiotransferase MtaB [Oscillospiraceae bacterium]
MKVFFETFGCKVNVYETSALIRLFNEAGFERTDTLSEADVVVINSCTVTENADRKARTFVRKARAVVPDAAIVLCGCYAQAFPDKAAKIQPDILMGTSDRNTTPQIVLDYLKDREQRNLVHPFTNASYEIMNAEELVEHTRAFLKIQDGCEKYCSYCAIPKARGPVRSMPLAEVRRQCEGFASNGYKEIVLCGINLSAYGADLGCDLGDAVMTCQDIEGISRIRLSSLECDILTEDMLEKFAGCDKFCPQFHLSLQSGCDRTLRRMNRHYTSDEYYHICEKIRSLFDNPTFTTDIIVGFPGETEEDFEDSVSFCRKVGFLRAHVFPYSRRSGTMADALPDQITRAEKERRSRIMIAAMKERSGEILNSLVGKKERIILEQPDGNGVFGYSDRYLPCRVIGDGLQTNQIVIGTVERIENGTAVVIPETIRL